MRSFDVFLKHQLDGIRKDNLYRVLRQVQSAEGPEIVLEGRRVLQFASNDYLGLSRHPKVLDGARAALEKYGSGSGASRLVSGNLEIHERLEAALAEWLGCDSALVFATGSMANLGALSALLGPKDMAYLDKQCHATLYDGVALAGATLKRFKHQDLVQLETLLRGAAPGSHKLIAVDSVYSMDGDVADLEGLAKVSSRHGAWLMVDEAHGLGVLGDEGRGAVAAAGLDSSQVDIRVGTFSKSFGGQGGFVAGDAYLRDYLTNTSRNMIFSTGLAPAAAGAALAALEVIRREGGRRERLKLNAAFLMNELRRAGYQVLKPGAAIVPLMMGGPEEALKAQAALWEEGIYVPAVRPPTVARTQCRLRISVSSEHSLEQLERLVAAIKKAVHAPATH